MRTKLIEFENGVTPLSAENLNPIARLAEEAEALALNGISTAQLTEERSSIEFRQIRQMIDEIISLFGSAITVDQLAALNLTVGRLASAANIDDRFTVIRVAINGWPLLNSLTNN